VHVQVIRDAGASGPAEVHPDVDALRPVHLGQRDLGALRQQRDLGQFLRGEAGQRRDVAVRHHHQVAAVVRIQVEDDERVRPARDDERLVGAARHVAEDAGLGGGSAGHVGQPPRGREAFHKTGRE
jgi:hypothetical protein